jgi:hypothetical protein
MAYDYTTDIFDPLWDGGGSPEKDEEPYATIIADNPDLFDEDSEQRILSTIEAIRSHMELLADRDEARLFHFCLSTMLEGVGSGGFVYGATSRNEQAIVEGNVVNPVFVAGDEIEFGTLDGVTGTAVTVVASDGASAGITLDDVITSINDANPLSSSIFAERTQDGRLRIFQIPVGGASAAAGFVINRSIGADDLIVTRAGIVTQEPGARAVQSGDGGGYYLPKVIEVANKCRDRALAVFVGQIREPGLNT